MRMARAGVIVLVGLLMASLAGNVLLYPAARQPLSEVEDQPLIDRTMAMHTIGGGRTDVNGTDFFPIVIHAGDRSCVEIRHRHRLGNIGACFDRRTGEVLEETSSVADRVPILLERAEDWMTRAIGWP